MMVGEGMKPAKACCVEAKSCKHEYMGKWMEETHTFKISPKYEHVKYNNHLIKLGLFF